MKIGDTVKSKATGKLYKVVAQKAGREGFLCDSITHDDSQYYFFDEEVDVVSEMEERVENIVRESVCEYCEKTLHMGKKVGKVDSCELMGNMPIIDEFSEKKIVPNGNNPVQYIRKYKDRYSLVTEFSNDEGTVILLPINYCPMCGRRLDK